MPEKLSQRALIIRALARGDGQMMKDFDHVIAGEVMYGGQADQVEVLIASEQRLALRAAARQLEGIARLTRGLPGDGHRRKEIAASIDLLRSYGQSLTKSAQELYDRRRSATIGPARDFQPTPSPDDLPCVAGEGGGGL